PFTNSCPRYFSTDSQRRRARGLNYELTTTRSANRSEYRHRRQKKRAVLDEAGALDNGVGNANKSSENLIQEEVEKKIDKVPILTSVTSQNGGGDGRRKSGDGVEKENIGMRNVEGLLCTDL
ncbi:Hypothetical protein FKW44_005038, partial [Caligus rogercresseyi]